VTTGTLLFVIRPLSPEMSEALLRASLIRALQALPHPIMQVGGMSGMKVSRAREGIEALVRFDGPEGWHLTHAATFQLQGLQCDQLGR
jgi:hypothetical protein